MAERKILSVTGLLAVFGISVKDRDETRPAKFEFCKDAASFKPWVASLSDTPDKDGDSPAGRVYELALYAADLKARAAAREAVAAESTIVKRDGKEIDIMKLPVERAVGAINAAYAEVSMLGGKPGGAFAASRRKLLEAGTVVEKDGALVVKK
jgi:hypothetical protein